MCRIKVSRIVDLIYRNFINRVIDQPDLPAEPWDEQICGAHKIVHELNEFNRLHQVGYPKQPVLEIFYPFTVEEAIYMLSVQDSQYLARFHRFEEKGGSNQLKHLIERAGIIELLEND